MRLEELTKSKIAKTTNSNLYVLRLRFLQLFAKYMGFEKREPLLKVEWDIFFKRYKILSREFETRELKFNKRGIDKELEKTKKFFIKILKSSILVNIDNDNFLIDPKLHKKDLDSDIDYVIVTKKDDNCDFLKEYELPIYSMGKILDKLEAINKHLFMKPLQITKDKSVITPIKISKDSMGLRITKGDIKVSILPELFPLTKVAGDLISKTIWITKVNDYENDGVTGELSFVELMKLADELNPVKIYLVNLSKNVLDYKEKIDEALKKWSGQILEEGETLNEGSFRISKPEVTEKYVRIPVRDCKITATIDISTEKGIKALYCGKEKQIATYLFSTDKWDMERAKKWVEEQKTEKVNKKLSDAQQKDFDRETAIINENKKKPLAEKVHRFKAAKWTHPNGHPRCLICGDEEPIGGVCNMPDSWYDKYEFDDEEAWAKERKTLREKGILKVDEKTEKAEIHNLECIECGYKMTTEQHGPGLKCPKCGGQMRRTDRPGIGRDSKEEPTMGSNKEKPTEEPKEETEKVKKNDEINFEFQKIDRKEFIVGGVIYHADKEDSQGDSASGEEIWKALKRYARKKKNIKVMHRGASRNVPIIENYFVEEGHHKGGKDEKNFLSKGDWYLSIYLGDKGNKDIWDDVVNKRLSGFSMAGRAESD